MADISYKCPCCGGAVSFDSSLQKMKCPYCDTEFDVSSLKDYDDILKSNENHEQSTEWESEQQEFTEDETSGMRVYVCNSCGGEIIGDETLGATSCPFCGNPVILSGQFKGDLKPDYVIPFKLDKNDAKEKLASHIKGKRLIPKLFKSQNHIEEIKGIYVPFWLFDADVNASVRYKATKIRTWSTSSYIYTETSFYSILREGSVGFSRIPVDGSTKMADDLMESIEPFDFSEAVDFQTAYLSGYLADRYDVTAQESFERANARIAKSTADAFESTVMGYNTVSAENAKIAFSNNSYKYALYPVWILNTDWNGKKYTFAMNGQTGKFVGDLPLDKGAYWRWFLGLFAGVSAAAMIITTLFNTFFG